MRFPFLDRDFADPLLRYNEGLDELKAKLPADQYLEVTFISLASITYEFTDRFLRDLK